MFTSSHIPPPGRLAAPFVAIALIVGACSSAATTPAPAAATPAPTTAASASTAAGGSATLAIGETAALGKFLTDADGNTLYIFKADTTANQSTCVDACLANWPPLVAAGGTAPAAPAGATGTFAVFARPDGTMQVSYKGQPLYFFAKDTKAGDTNGQGLAGGKWVVATP
jgi:predicted lipoprotein with Yx(FWY)xxD motif